MKFLTKFALAVALAVCGPLAFAQGVQNLYVAGGSYNATASPKFAATGMYAHAVSPDTAPGMYAFTLVDALPTTDKTFTTNIGAGIAQRVATIAGHDVMVPTSAGLSLNGSNVGWSWSTGATVPFQVKPNWYLLPTVRVVKSSVSGGAGYQPIFSLLFGYGK